MGEENSTEIIDEDVVYNFIEERGGGVSFVEIENRFGKGEYAYMNDKTNIVYWHGLPASVVDTLIELIHRKKKIISRPTTILIYAADGGFMGLPVVNRIPKNGYKDPHWLPLVLWTVKQVREGKLLSAKMMKIYQEYGYDI